MKNALNGINDTGKLCVPKVRKLLRIIVSRNVCHEKSPRPKQIFQN